MSLIEEIERLREVIKSDREALPYQEGQGYYRMRADIQEKERKLREKEKELENANPDAPKG